MAETLATMLTMTTYGMWLRGDARGWVDEGVIRPPDPVLERVDRDRMKHPPFRFDRADLGSVGRMIGRSLTDRLGVSVLALTVQCWHVHVVVGPTAIPVGKIVKTAKDAVRWGLRPGRPIWADGYDKRFCFNRASLAARVRYVAKHNELDGGQARPWDFLAAQTPGESPGANGRDV